MTRDDSAAANDRLVRDFIAAWERRESDFIIGCFAEDAVYHSMPLTPIEGKAAIADWVRGFEGKKSGRLEVHHQIATEHVVMNERTDHIELNGHSVALPITGVFEINDGKIGAWREYFDLTPAKQAYESPPG